MMGKGGRPAFRRTTSMSGINATLGDISPPPPPPPPKSETGGGFADAIVCPSGSYDEGSVPMLPPKPLIGGSGDSSGEEMPSFLMTCGLCHRRLPPGRDIYMYRGDAAFCSLECRAQKIKQDEKKERRAIAMARVLKNSGSHNHTKVAAPTPSDSSGKSEPVAAA